MEDVAVFALVVTFQTTVLAAGVWWFIASETRLDRTHGVGRAVATYAGISAVCTVGTLVAAWVGGVMWCVSLVALLGLTARQAIQISLATNIIAWVLMIGFAAVVPTEVIDAPEEDRRPKGRARAGD